MTKAQAPWGRRPAQEPKPPPRTVKPAVILVSTDFAEAIRKNRFRSLMLCVFLVLVLASLGYVLGMTIETFCGPEYGYDLRRTTGTHGLPEWVSVAGLVGAAILTVIAVIWSSVAMIAGDKVVLAMTGVREVRSSEEPMLHNVVEEMAIAAGIKKPRVCIMETEALNAFATGMNPDKGVVCVTRGLLDFMDREELQGVVAHETGHIVNSDIRFATMIAVMVGLIAMVAHMMLNSARFGVYASAGRRRSSGRGGGAQIVIVLAVFILAAILAPLAAKLVQMAISREREYLADATSVKLTRNPRGMISALEKLETSAIAFKNPNKAIQHMYISNPVKKYSERSRSLFSTHPATSLRIKRLTHLG